MNRWIYVLIGGITFVVFLAVMAPASLVVYFADDELAGVPDLKLGATTGTVWQGDLELQYRAFPAIRVSWDLSAPALVLGRASADVRMTADGLLADYSTNIDRSITQISNLDASIESSYINPVTVPYGLDLSGTFNLEVPRITVTNGWPTELDGDLYWAGGIVHIETPQQFYSVKLPPMDGKLSLDGETARLEITESGTRLMRIDVRPDGWTRVVIDYTLIHLTGMAVPGASAGQSGPAFVLEEKIF